MCVHSGCVWCVCMTHGGVCVWRAWGGRRLGLPSQASRGPVPRGGEGANSAQESLHHRCYLPGPDSRQMRVSLSGPDNSRCVLITGRLTQEVHVER